MFQHNCLPAIVVVLKQSRLTMRMLGENNPTAAVDASSAPPLVTPASAAAMAGGVIQPPAGGRSSDASFDADMVIILAAMLCVLVCAIVLDSLIRCFRLHCGRTPTTVAAPHAAATMAAAADAVMKKRELIMRRIPVVVYEATNKAGVSATECAICLGEFDDGEKVRVLPRCHHDFHVECIDMWLATNPSCPTCRNSLLGDGGASDRGRDDLV